MRRKTDAENVCGDEPEKGQWFWQCPFPDVLEEMCRILQCDRLYILPSSIHDAIVMPQDLGMSPEELQGMVKNVNKDCVTEEEYLSDSVYG